MSLIKKSSLPFISSQIPVTVKRFSTISEETEHHAAKIHSQTVGNGAHFIPLLGVSSCFVVVIHWLKSRQKATLNG
jgi:hypothetical protein